MKTAVVIGAGFVGAACAWQIQRAGLQTLIVDPGDFESAASWGNAGHLAIEQIEPLASLANIRSVPRRLFTLGGPVSFPVRNVSQWLPFGLKLLAASAPQRFERGQQALSGLLAQAMPAWQRLTQQTNTAQYLRADGHYVVWESSQTAARGKRHWLNADIGEARAQAASAAEIIMLRKQFNARPVDAVRIDHPGQITDLAMARSGIMAALHNHGGATHQVRAAAISIAEGKATVQLSDGSTIMPNIIVVAAGVRSAALLRRSEGVVPLIAERGYHVEMKAPNQTNTLPPVAFDDRSIIITQFASTQRVAGFTEFSHVDSPPDRRKWEALSRHAVALGLPFSKDTSQWIGARPTLPDYLPAIGRSLAASNLIYAFGHQHLGLTLAAITGELVAAIATDVPPEVELSPFNLKRFQ